MAAGSRRQAGRSGASDREWGRRLAIVAGCGGSMPLPVAWRASFWDSGQKKCKFTLVYMRELERVLEAQAGCCWAGIRD